ncbi:MAG: haloalkane dehalogenase [Halieaceae bacterium]|nr:haloalkane dehalogenase [Halieaceae bacterium]
MGVMSKVAAVLAALLLVATFVLLRDGEHIIPHGEGTVKLEEGEFEAFPLPDYVAAVVSDAYKSYFIEVEPGIKIHVLEVGQGYPVYLQHGNPTTGLLYRKVVESLPLYRVRVIMPTMVGLGFSTKIPASEHTLDNHMHWMKKLLTMLDLTEAIYVGQDWGGPVGMGALSLSPGVLKGAVLMNTGFSAPRVPIDLSRAHALVKTPLVGEFVVEVMSSFFFQRLGRVQGDPTTMPPDVLDLYRRPLQDSGNAKATLALMRMVPDGPDHASAPALRDIEHYVTGLDIPVELVWGMNDPILAKALPVMQELFPAAPVTETEAGHFLQEEVPEAIAAAIMRLMDAVQTK